MRIFVMLFLSLHLIACSSTSEVKAPCDYYGHWCGKKMRINH